LDQFTQGVIYFCIDTKVSKTCQSSVGDQDRFVLLTRRSIHSDCYHREKQ